METAVQGNTLVATVLIGWLPAVCLMFAVLPPRRAVIASFIFAWLFLPMTSYKISLVPDLTKMTVTSLSVVCGMLIFDFGRLLTFRPRWLDVPMVVLCLCPMATSLSNGLGVYDGFSSTFTMIVTWGVPFFIGRVYFSDLDGLRELAIGIVIGGIIYIPFCLFEVRMSPQLHKIVYGYHQHSFGQTKRFGGWRPMVFMEHGLMVGMWMTAACLTGFWLWLTAATRRMTGAWGAAITATLLVTAVLCKSAGAVLLLVLGIVSLLVTKWLRTHAVMTTLVVVTTIYIALRSLGLWDGMALVSVFEDSFLRDRATSLESRLRQEVALSTRARERPVFGWGGWRRSHVRDSRGRDISITDSQWCLLFGKNGWVGLSAFMLSLLLPPIMLRWRVHPSLWHHPRAAGAVVLAMVLVLWMIDNAFNAMKNPIFLLVAGGLAGLSPLKNGLGVPGSSRPVSHSNESRRPVRKRPLYAPRESDHPS